MTLGSVLELSFPSTTAMVWFPLAAITSSPKSRRAKLIQIKLELRVILAPSPEIFILI